MQRGNLIIYDEEGTVISQTGDAMGDILPHTYPVGVPYVELEYGAYAIEFANSRLIGINVETKEPMFEPFEVNLDEIKQFKINQLNQLCESEIVAGFELQLSDGLKHYDFDRDTQMNMAALQGKITLMMVLGNPMTEVSWYATQQPCEMYSIQDFLTLCGYGEQFKTVLIEKCKTLKAQVRTCETKEAIDLIVW